jgi:hypothetical protein
MYTSVLKPGLLVSLKTNVKGGVEYERREMEADHTAEDGARVARWETARRIPDPAEYERAIQARGKARTAVISVCNVTSFGLLCPLSKEAELKTAVEVARGIADEFNLTAQRTQIEVYIIAGRVALDDLEAVKAISAEVRDLLADMEAGIKNADPEAIREAATKARAVGGMLTDDAAEKVTGAIAEARKAARDIVRRVEKAGEQAGAVVAELSVANIQAARFAFLDIEPGTQPAPDSEAPAAPSLDLAPCVPLSDIQMARAADPLSLDFTAPEVRS